jgi:hypothetical protein
VGTDNSGGSFLSLDPTYYMHYQVQYVSLQGHSASANIHRNANCSITQEHPHFTLAHLRTPNGDQTDIKLRGTRSRTGQQTRAAQTLASGTDEVPHIGSRDIQNGLLREQQILPQFDLAVGKSQTLKQFGLYA